MSGCSGHGTLKLAGSQEEIDRVNLVFACFYKFRKAKGYFDNFYVGVVKNGDGPLGHGILKSARPFRAIWEMGAFWGTFH